MTAEELSEIAINLVTYALEKQRPKAPTETQIHFCCRSCGRPVGVRMMYCSQCGQRIDWGKNDDE